MRVLVLGGTAFLGRSIAVAARDAGHHVTCLARGVSGSVPAGVTWVRADRTEPGAHDAVTGSWDAVVDVARQPGQVRRSLDALADSTGHWVFVSTGSVYADTATAGLTEEAALLDPVTDDEVGDERYGAGKVACEQAVLAATGEERALLARAGLIGGPGDWSFRTGYWPWRFAHPGSGGRVLVPDVPDHPVQIVDVRDLAAWLVRCAEDRLAGAVNAVGPTMRLDDVLRSSREAAGSNASLIPASPEALRDAGVGFWSGPRSLPLWIDDPDWAGFTARSGDAARAAGLTTRPLAETLVDTLLAERGRPDHAPREAGLTDAEHDDLLARLDGPP